MTSETKSELSSGFLRAALYLTIFAACFELLEALAPARLRPGWIALPHAAAALISWSLFRGRLVWQAGSEGLIERSSVTVLMGAGIIGLGAFLSAPVPAGGSLAWIISAGLVGPAAEEIFFRGIAFSEARPLWRIPLQAVVFSAAHMDLALIPYTLAGGLLLGVTAFRYGLVWSIACHVFVNLFSIYGALSQNELSTVTAVLFLLAALAALLTMRNRTQQ